MILSYSFHVNLVPDNFLAAVVFIFKLNCSNVRI
jgi:hypothetical protein